MFDHIGFGVSDYAASKDFFFSKRSSPWATASSWKALMASVSAPQLSHCFG